jgi:type IV pilus assembly protein PilW
MNRILPHASSWVSNVTKRQAGKAETIAGFGLVELMIAMALGLMVLGAAIAVFQSNLRSFNANEGQNRIQEGARAAYEMLSRDIRATGGTACSTLARPDEEHSYTTDETNLLTAPITGGANEFTVLSGDDSSYQVTAATSTTVDVKPEATTNWKLSHAFDVDDKLVLCNATLMYVVKVTNVDDSSNKLTFTPATPLPIYSDVAPPATVSAARFRSARWYLNNGSLYVNRNGTAEAVIPGVTALNVSYLERNGTSYTSSPTFLDVVAVRVNLTLRGQKTLGGDVQVDGNNYITRTTSNVAAIRSRAP